jgi:hypothetical protein
LLLCYFIITNSDHSDVPVAIDSREITNPLVDFDRYLQDITQLRRDYILDPKFQILNREDHWTVLPRIPKENFSFHDWSKEGF